MARLSKSGRRPYRLGRRAETTGGARGAGMRERGVIIASGLMAGGALGGVLGAAMRLLPGYSAEWVKLPFYDDVAIAQSVSVAAFALLCVYVWRGALKAPEEAA